MINRYVALDIETTGLNPAVDRIIEVGMARVEDGQITQKYSTLVYPGISVSERITELRAYIMKSWQVSRELKKL